MKIDISANNGLINWLRVKSDPQKIDGVYLKANEGVGFTDSRLKYNATMCKEFNIPIGYYHFASLNTSVNIEDDARAEARYFLNDLKDLPAPGLPYALDIETNKAKLTPSQVYSWIVAFFDELAKKGITDVVLYSYGPFLNEYLPAKHDLGKYRLWLAAYNNDPVLPKNWTKFWMHQFSSKGSVQGINGYVDLNKMPEEAVLEK